jgi:YHS domain-containing protein
MDEQPNSIECRKTMRSHNKGSQKTADFLLVISLLTVAAVYVASRREQETRMPEKVVNEAELSLYITSGGAYTDEDIIANGRQTASQKFVTFRAKHDFNPKVGDMICPVTRTKANPMCSWVIGGKEYYFCCPPCIDEFLALAKSDPDTIMAPTDYVMRSK